MSIAANRPIAISNSWQELALSEAAKKWLCDNGYTDVAEEKWANENEVEYWSNPAIIECYNALGKETSKYNNMTLGVINPDYSCWLSVSTSGSGMVVERQAKRSKLAEFCANNDVDGLVEYLNGVRLHSCWRVVEYED